MTVLWTNHHRETPCSKAWVLASHQPSNIRVRSTHTSSLLDNTNNNAFWMTSFLHHGKFVKHGAVWGRCSYGGKTQEDREQSASSGNSPRNSGDHRSPDGLAWPTQKAKGATPGTGNCWKQKPGLRGHFIHFSYFIQFIPISVYIYTYTVSFSIKKQSYKN